jgi:fido (protein-threonine AMPylation protein)
MIQGEPDQKERGFNWHTAVGLQQTDGLKTSDFLIATANKNINGDITLEEAKKLIDSYYETTPAGHDDKNRTEEADKVSARITQLLSEKTFSFSPAEYLSIHRDLFQGIYKFAGKMRDYNISKKEWVLNGETVYYARAGSVRDTLEYDFTQEKRFDYKGLSMVQTSEHIARFTSGLWQIHAFGEGNTRTTAVFIIKYLRSLGFDVTNDIFAENAWYFRNALVRANYSNHKAGIHASQEFLNRFFGNLLLGEKNILRNRDLHMSVTVSADDPVNDPVNADYPANGTVNDTVNAYNTFNDTVNGTSKLSAIQQRILVSLLENPHATALQMAKQTNVSEKTVKRALSALKTANLIERIGSDKKGHWLVKNVNKTL